jgi:hypothetical protein
VTAERAGVILMTATVVSADTVRRLKPAPEPYLMWPDGDPTLNIRADPG